MFSLDNNDILICNYNNFMSTEEKLAATDKQAVKYDDAEIPVFIWNDRLLKNYPMPTAIQGIPWEKLDKALFNLRKF